MNDSQTLHANELILLLTTVGGLWVLKRVIKVTGRLLNFRALLLTNVILIGPISGLAHLALFQGAARGYYDVTVSPGLGVATLGTVVATTVISLTSLRALDAVAEPPARRALLLDRAEQRMLMVLALIFLPISLYAVARVSQYAEDSGLVRLISVDQGIARYSFVSNWLVWVVTFAAVVVTARLQRSAPILAALAALLCVAAIVASLSWTGGRSIILVMVLPLLMVVSPALRRFRWLVAGAVTPFVGYIVLSVDQVRVGSSTSAAYLTWPTWFDWQWGRYSLLGFAGNYVDSNGYLLGETFAASTAHFIEGTGKLLGLALPHDGLHQVTDITGAELAGNVNVIYIVPGLTAELYLNFGILGVAIGSYVLARLAQWTDHRCEQATTTTCRLTWIYFGVLLVFRTLTSSSDAILSYLFYIGFPLLVASMASLVLRRRSAEIIFRAPATPEDLERAIFAERPPRTEKPAVSASATRPAEPVGVRYPIPAGRVINA